jgi:hypothetical protein
VTNQKGESVSSTSVFEQMHRALVRTYGEDYCIIPFKKSEREKYSAMIDKFVNVESQRSIEDLSQQIEKNIICSYDDIEFLGEVNPVGYAERGYKMHKVCINDCPFLLY